MSLLSSSQAFLTHFFTHYLGTFSGADNSGIFSPVSPLTEPFLLRLCRTHHLITATDLFLFLIAEEDYILRAARNEAQSGNDLYGFRHGGPLPPIQRTSGDDAAPAAVFCKRPRHETSAMNIALDSDHLLRALIAALSQCLLEEGPMRHDTAGEWRNPPVNWFPSLLQQRQQCRESTRHCSASAVTSAVFYSTGCPAVDALLSSSDALARCDVQELDKLSTGGFCGGQLTELSGEAGTGKTLIVLQTGLTYITRKLAAGILCEYFGHYTARGTHPATTSEWESSAAAPIAASDATAMRREGVADHQPQPHPLQEVWPAVRQLLHRLHNEERNRFFASDSDDASSAESVSRALLRIAALSSPICCFYLVSEDVPAARLSSLAAGAVKTTRHSLLQFFAPLVTGEVYNGLSRALRAELTVMSVLSELKVRRFSSLEELLALTTSTEVVDSAHAVQGQLVTVIAALQHRRVMSDAVGVHEQDFRQGGGLVLFDSIAAAAMHSGEKSTTTTTTTTTTGADDDDDDDGDATAKCTTTAGEERRRQHSVRVLLGRVGDHLRSLASRFNLCVLVTNQVRCHVERHHHLSPSSLFSPQNGDVRCRDAVGLVWQPLLRLKTQHGVATTAKKSRRGKLFGQAEDTDPVPALGIAWGLFPHTRLFLRKLPSPSTCLSTCSSAFGGGGAVREIVLIRSPFAAPGALGYVITTDGMRSMETEPS